MEKKYLFEYESPVVEITYLPSTDVLEQSTDIDFPEPDGWI